MNARLSKTLAAMTLFAALTYPQSQTKTPETKTPDENRAAASDEAAREAKRQGRVALTPDAGQSPTQTMQQAIAFERYKELAAQREALKQGTASGADRRTEKSRPAKAQPAKEQ